MKIKLIYLFIIFAGCSLFKPNIFSQPPSLINFRGQLLNSSGQPVTSTVTVELRIFASQIGGAQLYLENIGNVEVINGQYAFQFGSNGSPDFKSVIQDNAETWVEITIAGDVLPRQRFVSVPYALSAGNAVVAPGSVTTSMLSDTILKYLRPEITAQPTISDQPEWGESLTLSSQSEGKYLTHQWYRNGEQIPGATQASYTIPSVNSQDHDGNYTVVVTNDFGSVTSEVINLQVQGSTMPSPWFVQSQDLDFRSAQDIEVSSNDQFTIVGSIGSGGYAKSFDSEQSVKWTFSTSKTNQTFLKGVSSDSSGNFYLCGHLGADDNWGGLTVSHNYQRDPWVGKVDASGNWLWVKPIATSAWSGADAVYTDSSGNSFITGYVYGTHQHWHSKCRRAWMVRCFSSKNRCRW